MGYSLEAFNLSLPGQNGRHFADDIFRCIFVNEFFFFFWGGGGGGGGVNRPCVGSDNGLSLVGYLAIISTDVN